MRVDRAVVSARADIAGGRNSCRGCQAPGRKGARVICPKDMQPCCDDLCYGGGCLMMDGAPMLHKCLGCNAWISDDDTMDCVCEPEYFEDDPVGGSAG